MFVFIPNRCEISPFTFFRSPAYSLTPNSPPSLRLNILIGTQPRVHPSLMPHRIVSNSDIICNNSNSVLADIILFRLSPSDFPSSFFKTYLVGRGFYALLGRCFHTLVNNVFCFQLTWDFTIHPFGGTRHH